ncbi:LamG-like jellyroll fold domain-containing protein [Solirubrobacter soli]|uniref:LamG-like jellyroll fold domain-containing protein n=1 Tax=Solirubrobacter soli TaxID=363832 RepID=UPI0003F5F7C5|nr:LamG-like jellyroll fold domain-containing protein [Solirubrobacter soli]
MRLSAALAFTAIALTSLSLTTRDARAADGLVAAYSFDENAGSTLGDSSGAHHDGTIANATWTTGKFGSALNFNGTNASVALPALGTFYKTGYTLEAWVNKAGATKDVGVLGAWNYPAGGPMIWVDHIDGRYYGTLSTGMSSYVDSTKSPTPGTWQYLTVTYDGATAKFYVNGALTATKAFAGDVGSSNDWRIGAYGSSAGNFFDGLIDEVRIYDDARTATEVTTDMNQRVGGPDTTPPTAPTNFAKTGSSPTSISTSWTASTDDRAVTGYRVYRSGNLVTTVTGTSYTFSGLTCGTSYPLGVEAFDAAGNASTRTALTASTGACDTTPPSVSITTPASGATVSGSATINATASDGDSVAGVQFKVDGANIGSEDTSAPYSVVWDASTIALGPHTLTAVARDPSGNTAASAGVNITVTAPPAGSGPVAAYSFDDGAGALAGDASGNGHEGTILNGTWTGSGKFGGAIDFNGSNTRVDLPSLGRFYKSGYTLEAWVKSAGKIDVGVVGSWNAGTAGGPMIWVDHIAGHYYGVVNSGMSNYLDSGQNAVSGTWQHVAVTYDMSTLRFYVNGVEVASKPYTSNVGDTDLWKIGAYGNPIGGYFDGLIDEVRIYSRALTAPQLANDMSTPVASSVAVTANTPAVDATDQSADPDVTASFNVAMAPASITTTTFQLKDASNNVVPATVSYDAASGKATLSPTVALNYGATYTATVKGGASGVTSAGGGTLPSSRSWSFTVEARPPVLVLTAAAQPFSSYVPEILKAEGLDAFTSMDLSLATSTVLSGFDQVILGDVPLTVGQVTMLTNWVNAGGSLIALHPDKKLAPLLGLTDLSSTLSNAYLKVNTGAGTPGAGIVGDTIQYHGSADRYALNGATAVATLYSTATVATTSPAVTTRSVGANGGDASAFMYDLARSIVYTRQGNPAWAGQDRDAVAPIRPDDLFFGAKAGDIQPDWVDLSKVQIPQADEQQRLLANVMTDNAASRTPLPRFWYLPHSYKAAVVMTGDDHAYGGTAGRFDKYIAASPAGCSVDDWECVRSTSYIYSNSPLTDAQAQDYASKGFEVAMHISPAAINDLGCANWSATTLPNIFDTQLAAFNFKYKSVAGQDTLRMHCVSWSDWATAAKVDASHGIRLDTNYYYYPNTWMASKPGFMTGSGMPMRFADTDGSLIDVYQANTDITDESGQAEPSTINSLLDNAVGSAGYYGAFVANIHTDNAASTDSDAIIASAQARNVPVISAKQLLTWTDGREDSSFASLSFASNTLSFKIKPGAGTEGLTAMLPMTNRGKTLQSITLNGSVNVSFTTKTIKGVSYAFFDADPGTYAAQYA